VNVPTSALERAFDLAKSGRFSTIYDIERQLSEEGYQNDCLEGPVLRSQIKALIAAARPTVKQTIHTALAGRAPWVT
jgi:hypothetical protein